MSVKLLFLVAFGGALGAVFRFVMMSGIGHVIQAGFPYSTLVVNVAGSFVLGLLTEIIEHNWTFGQEFQSFLLVGVLGSFTTFSAFSQDVVFLIESGELSLAALYIALSVVLSIAGAFAGMFLFRQILV